MDDFGYEKKKKKDKKEKKRDDFDEDFGGGGFGAGDGDFGLTRAEPNTMQFEAAADGTIQVAGDEDQPVLRNIAKYCDFVRALDLGVYEDVGRSIAAMDDELRKVREESCDMEYEVQKRYVEASEADAERKVLEARWKDAQSRLSTLHVDRHGMAVNHVSVGDDRSRIAEDLSFLNKSIEQEEESLLFITRSSGFIKKSFEDIEAHHKLLETQRVRLLQEVQAERAKMAEELQLTKEMRQLEEKMRTDQKEAVTARVAEAAFRAVDDFLQTPLDKGPSNLRTGRVLSGI
jgi:hypothetical protein